MRLKTIKYKTINTIIFIVFISSCVSEQVQESTETPVIIMIKNNNHKGVENFILGGGDVNIIDTKARNLIALATIQNNINLVKLLMSYGSNIDHSDIYGNTAVDEAKRRGFHDIANLYDKCWDNGSLTTLCGEELVHIIDLDDKDLQKSCKDGTNHNNICLTGTLQNVTEEAVTVHFNIKNYPPNTTLHTKINGAEIAPIKVRTRGIRGLNIGNTIINEYKIQKGLSNIESYLTDENGKIINGEVVNYSVVANYSAKKPSLYAVVIGIDDYEEPSFTLENASSDAITFGRSLYKGTEEVFDKVNIIYLTKKHNTTKNNIIKILKSLNIISPNDFFVFYSASHGVVYDDIFYLVTSNVAKADQQSLNNNALTGKTLSKLFSQIPTSNKLLLFDSCHSGAVNKQLLHSVKTNISEFNLTSIAAARIDQKAIEGYKDGRGIFTSVLVDALEGENNADFNHDGIIKSEELIAHINEYIPLIAKQFHRIQIPSIYQTGQTFPVTKTRFRTKTIDVTTQFFKKEQMKKLVLAIKKKNIKRYNDLLSLKKHEIKNKVKEISKIPNDTTLPDSIKEKLGRITFAFEGNKIHLDIKDKIKTHKTFVDNKGRILIYIDSYSNKFTKHIVKTMGTLKVSEIDIGWHNTFYRVTLHLKKLSNYKFTPDKNGVFIEVLNCNNQTACGILLPN